MKVKSAIAGGALIAGSENKLIWNDVDHFGGKLGTRMEPVKARISFRSQNRSV